MVCSSSCFLGYMRGLDRGGVGMCHLLSRVRLGDPVDCSPLRSSVHGILHARILEYFAISFYTRGSVVVAKELHQFRIFNSW